MQRYVKRGFEDEICNLLNEHRVICLVGLPGVGKTTTSRYIAVKMQREKRKENKEVPIVVLTHEKAAEKEVKPRITEFCDENGEKHEIYEVSFRSFWEQEPGEIKYLARLVVSIANRSFFGRMKPRKRDAESLADVFRDVFSEFSGMLKEHAEKFLGDYGILLADVSQLLFGFGLSFLGSLAGSAVSGAVKEILKGDVKLKGELILIVDDVADLTPRELSNAVDFVRWLKESGAKVILVERIDDFEKYLEIYENLYSEKPFDFNKVFDGAKNLIDWNEQFHLMEAAEREEFEEMLRVNGYEKEKIRRVLKTEREDVVDLLYSACAGSISIALMMLDAGISAEEMPKPVGRYFSTEEIRENEDWEKKGRMIRSNRARMNAGIKAIYEKIREKNFALLALFAQDVAEEELEQLCKDKPIENLCRSKGYPLFWNLEDFNWMLKSYEESFAGRKRKVYSLNERWEKMRSFVKTLKDKAVEEEIKVIREVLLRIMTADCEKYGGCTLRMLFYALENIEWLKERKIFKLKEALFWGGMALGIMPFTGFQFKEVVEDLWEKEEHDDEILLYASAYAHRLVEHGKHMFGGPEEYLRLVKFAEKFMEKETKDDAVLCHRAMAYSSSAYGLSYSGLEEHAKECLSKANEIIESMSELKELAEFYFYLDKAGIEEITGGNPFESLKKSEECLKKLEKTEITGAMKRFLKLAGGEVEEAFKEQLNGIYTAIYSCLAGAYMDADEMEEARKCFEKALGHSEDVDDELVFKSYLGKIEVIERYKFEWKVREEKISFKDLWDGCKGNLWKLTAEYIAGTCAEYLASEIVKGEFKREDLEYAKLHPYAFSLLNGIGCIFGFIDKHDALKELKELDLRWLPVDIRNSGEPARLIEIKKHVEELYNSVLGLTRKEEYELIKEIEVIGGKPTWCIIFSSWQALARIMLFYIVNDLRYAQKLAEYASEAYTKLLNRLFKELAEAIKREIEGDKNAKEEVKRAFVKLFYYHI